MRKLILALIVAMSVGACTTITSHISSFSELPAELTGKTIHLVAHPEEKNASLEWKSYRRKFADGFRKAGFTISGIETADYIASVSYGIGDKTVTQKTDSSPDFVYGGHDVHTTTRTTYTRHITIDIVDGATRNDTQPVKVYEGRLHSIGACSRLQAVIDEMIDAFFQKFPNNSGKITVSRTSDC